MKTGLLRGSGGGTNGASVSSPEIDAILSQTIEIGSENVGLSVCLAVGLSVGADRPPTQVIDVKVEDVRLGRRAYGPCERKEKIRQERGIHGRKESILLL